MKREHTHVRISATTDRLAAGIAATDCVRGIFDNNSSFRKRVDPGGIVREPGEIHGDYCLNIRRRCQRLLKRTRGHTKCVGIDIDKTRLAAGIKKAICRRRKSNRCGQAAIARPNPGRKTSKVEACRSTADRDRVAGADAFSQGGFETFDRGTLREEIAAEHRNNRIDIRLIDALAPVTENRGHSHLTWNKGWREARLSNDPRGSIPVASSQGNHRRVP